MSKLLVITQKVDANDQLLGFFISWLRGLAKRTDKLTVLCLNVGEYDLPSNVRIIDLGKDHGISKPRQLFNFYKNIISLRNEYDAVFVHMNPIWVVLGGIPWHMMRKEILLWYTHKSVTWKLRLAAHGADVILTASPESFRLPSNKIIVTGHGIDTELFRPDPAKWPVGLKILSVGRIAPVKNYETLLDAAKILKERSIPFSVTLVGEPALKHDIEYEKLLKNIIREYSLDGYFHFVGKVQNRDLVPYYQSHNIFVHLSKTGSLDKTVLEAMSCGMRVLSSNDASRAFLPEKYIVNAENSRILADKIIEMKDTPSDYQLRDYVVKNHNLDSLLDKISGYIR